MQEDSLVLAVAPLEKVFLNSVNVVQVLLVSGAETKAYTQHLTFHGERARILYGRGYGDTPQSWVEPPSYRERKVAGV